MVSSSPRLNRATIYHFKSISTLSTPIHVSFQLFTINNEGEIHNCIIEFRAELIKSLSLLKRNALAAPFERAFTIQKQLEANPPASDALPEQSETMELHYRFVLPLPSLTTSVTHCNNATIDRKKQSTFSLSQIE